jgi:hypothetical protein
MPANIIEIDWGQQMDWKQEALDVSKPQYLRPRGWPQDSDDFVKLHVSMLLIDSSACIVFDHSFESLNEIAASSSLEDGRREPNRDWL